MSTITTEHRFTAPDGEPWGRCTTCGLAESAHATALGAYPYAADYRCPYCVDRGVEACEHENAPLSVKGGPL